MSAVDIELLVEFVNAIAHGADTESVCRKCGEICSCDAELEPTPLCNLCAQAAVEMLPALVEQNSKDQAELASLRQQLATRERQLKLAVKGMKQGREVVVVVAMAGKHLVDLFERDASATSLILDDVELWPLDASGKPMPITKGGE